MFLNQKNLEKVITNYYLVIINPNIHRKTWNSIKLLMSIAESDYILFYDNELSIIHMQEITKDEFITYNYSLN